MTAARWRRNAALVERCSNAIQARYARRPQLFQERRQIDRGSGSHAPYGLGLRCSGRSGLRGDRLVLRQCASLRPCPPGLDAASVQVRCDAP
jgi:hypothetical protein